MIPERSGGLLAAEVVKAVREGDIDAVRSWLAAGGDEFVNEPAQYEYRRPLEPDVYYATEKLVYHAISGDSVNSLAMIEVLLQAGARPELNFLKAAISTKKRAPPLPRRTCAGGARSRRRGAPRTRPPRGRPTHGDWHASQTARRARGPAPGP